MNALSCLNFRSEIKNLRKNSKVLYLKYWQLLITNYSLLISQCSNPSFEGNRERVSASFHLENRLQLCDRKNET